MSNEEIVAYLDGLDKEASAIKRDLLRLCWYMRGGITYEDAMILDINEKAVINDIIKDNLEIAKKSGMPFF